MEQATIAELEHDSKRRRTLREIFLEKMDRLVPWERLEKRIEPFYPRAGCGRRPYPLRTMLRVHCVQLFHDLSDPGMEDLLYEVESVRRFAGLRLTGALPDETTILKFRHLLEKHGLGEGLFAEINAHLASPGHSARKGTIMDATIIEARSSTKNAKRERDPEMHQAKKGNQWRFGMNPPPSSACLHPGSRIRWWLSTFRRHRPRRRWRRRPPGPGRVRPAPCEPTPSWSRVA